MNNLWNDQEAARFASPLEQRVYTSRLQGADSSLVLHGGGNTSVKIVEKNIFGEDETILYVKGSGWDLATIETAGFAPCRMDHLLKLATLSQLSDTEMARQLQLSMTNPAAPAPSVEAILHAILPHTFVDHTHADSIITITNSMNGEKRIREIFDNDEMIIVPYVMPGFKLVRAIAELYQKHATSKTIGLILMNHGIFTFGATAKESYDRMIELVGKAEKYLQDKKAWNLDETNSTSATNNDRSNQTLAALRKEVSTIAGFPLILSSHADDVTLNFAQHKNIAKISQQGPATPDHVIRTKRIPMLGRDVQTYSEEYKKYFDKHAIQSSQSLTMLDPAPRVILDPEFGLISIGRTAAEASIAEDIYRHTIEIISRAEILGGYQALPPIDLFEMEYWELEQAKLKRQGAPKIFAGEIALVTGAASGIGKACVASLLMRGATVVGLDLNPSITTLHKRKDFLGLVCDVTNESSLHDALDKTVQHFGGLDMLILNAGIFPPSQKIANITIADWTKTMRINLDANLILLNKAYPLLKLAPRNGRVVVIGSKNVPAPGPGASAYSASKSALTQLARVAALEWGIDGIRVNVLHPNAVFDTGIWTDEVLKQRAINYGLTVEEYKTNNVLHTEVTSRDVAELAAEMCGALFAKTTGAQIPIDGGNERVI